MATHRDHVRTKGLRRAWDELRREWRAWCHHHHGVRRARRRPATGELPNIVCGKYCLPGWVNTDLFTDAGLAYDMREPWPVKDRMFSIVRLEHVLEHVGYGADARHVVGECQRALRPGGVVRIGVPDTEKVLRAYAEGPDAAYFLLARRGWHPPEARLPIEHVNFHFRDRYDEHKFAYDAETLCGLLRHAGLIDVVPAPFDPAIEREDREVGTLRLQGRKPALLETHA